jgi:hypothetical protein
LFRSFLVAPATLSQVLEYRLNKNEKNDQTVGTIPKSNIKIVERGKIDTLTHKYTTTHFPASVHALQLKVAELS